MPAALWIAIETKIGIVCACLPTLLPLFRKLNQGIRSRLSNSSNSRHFDNHPSSTHRGVVPSNFDKAGGGGAGCPNCSCANREGSGSGSRTNSNADSEKKKEREVKRKKGKKPRGWYSAALSNLSRADRGSVSESQEEIVGMRGVG